jgi:hypothetical protein
MAFLIDVSQRNFDRCFGGPPPSSLRVLLRVAMTDEAGAASTGCANACERAAFRGNACGC